MHMFIRVATPSDHAWLRHLNQLAYRDVVMRQFGAWDEQTQGEEFDAKLKRGAFRIIELKGRPVGAVWSEERDDHVYLHELIVLPDSQGQGIGSQILSLEIARAEALRKPVRLHVLALSRAVDLYIRKGFVETGRDDAFVDMERSLNAVDERDHPPEGRVGGTPAR
jgi:GNAT superfamily N-acetyltransferase